jgi:hypothetical protein
LSINLVPTTVKEIKNIFQSFESRSSFGYNEVYSKIRKKNLLTHDQWTIKPRALASRIVLDRLKWSIVKPLHKEGDKSNISNYKPTSSLLWVIYCSCQPRNHSFHKKKEDIWEGIPVCS